MKSLFVKKSSPQFADDDFSRSYSGVEMFQNDERRLRHFDALVVDDDGRSVLRPLIVDDDVISSVWFS